MLWLIVLNMLNGLTRPVIYFTPQGQTFNQQQAKILSTEQELILLCGHYEGLDERVRENWVDLELSIGDYVLTGGELPAMVVIDAVVRLLPGVLGDDQSAKNDSFYDGLLEHPHYTRPANFRGLSAPDVLLSGHHEQIRRWRLKESLRRTYYRRPDLIKTRSLTDEEKLLLAEIVNECSDERGKTMNVIEAITKEQLKKMCLILGLEILCEFM